MNIMKRALLVSFLCAGLLCLMAGLSPAQINTPNAIVILGPGSSVDKFLQRNQLQLLQALSDGRSLLVTCGSGAPNGNHTWDDFWNGVARDADVLSVEPNAATFLYESAGAPSGLLAQSTVALLNQSTVALLNGDNSTVNYYGTNVRTSYAEQPSLMLIRNDPAHQVSTGTGTVVADIDNGVDPGDPVLSNVLLPGYNFVDNNQDVSVWSDLDQSTVALLNHNDALGLDQSTVSLLNQSTVSLLNQSTVSLLNQSTVALLNQSTVALLNQSTVALLNQSTVALLNQSTVALLNQSTVSLLNSLPPAFGHGTMVAGLIHAVSPNARIMPLVAFDANGEGTLFDVVAAIYYAVDHGADVINMSFSFGEGSPILLKAILYAQSHGVMMVASMGNNGQLTLTSCPAAFPGVSGIAATDVNDILAPFSNYGPDVSYTAPGVNLITIYPGGHYALVSGTSFSSALVSGLASLSESARRSNPNRVYSSMNRAAVNIGNKNPQYRFLLGRGRIDELGTVNNMLNSGNFLF